MYICNAVTIDSLFIYCCYCCLLLVVYFRDEIRECGFSIIIDGHNSTWTAIKNLLKMFQECLPERIHVAYVVSPTQFLEKRRASTKASKEKLEFSTVVVSSVEKLLHQVAPSQVTTDLGGLLPYDHQKWIKLRLVSG